MKTQYELIVLLLQLIKFKGNINYLIYQGYSYVKVIDLLKHMVYKEYVVLNNKELILTRKGEYFLMLLNKKLNRKGLYRYMSPEFSHKIKKMEIAEIYIPLSKVKK